MTPEQFVAWISSDAAFTIFGEILLPFVALFIIVSYGLSKVGPLKSKKNIIAFAIAMLAILAHRMNSLQSCWDPVTILQTAVPELTLLMIGLVVFYIVTNIIGLRPQNSFPALPFLLVLGFTIYSFIGTGNCGLAYINFGDYSSVIIAVLALLTIAAIWSGGGELTRR